MLTEKIICLDNHNIRMYSNRMAQSQIKLVETPESACVMLDPTRATVLGGLAEPASAAELARRLDIPRQKVNYHLRELERVGAVELAEERRKGNCVERVVRRTATAYLVDPTILGQLGQSAAGRRDRFSWAYLVSLLARTIKDLSILRRRADEAGKSLATLAIETEVRFESPKAMNEFAEEAANMLATLATQYHNERSADGRRYRFVFAGLPKLTEPGQARDQHEESTP